MYNGYKHMSNYSSSDVTSQNNTKKSENDVPHIERYFDRENVSHEDIGNVITVYVATKASIDILKEVISTYEDCIKLCSDTTFDKCVNDLDKRLELLADRSDREHNAHTKLVINDVYGTIREAIKQAQKCKSVEAIKEYIVLQYSKCIKHLNALHEEAERLHEIVELLRAKERESEEN